MPLRSPQATIPLDFAAPAAAAPTSPEAVPAASATRIAARATEQPGIFGDEDNLPPTWSEHSRIYHTSARCTRLQSIRRNRRITGAFGTRDHCLNCISIAATLRRG